MGAALLLTAPFTPMLFMGEDWGATTPWQFFTGFEDAAVAARVSRGRRAEIAQHGSTGDVPDPQDESTLLRSKLDWSQCIDMEHQDILRFYRDLIALRRAFPDLSDPRLDRVQVEQSERLGGYVIVYRGRFVVVCNLLPERSSLRVRDEALALVLTSSPDAHLIGDNVGLAGEAVAILFAAGRTSWAD